MKKLMSKLVIWVGTAVFLTLAVNIAVHQVLRWCHIYDSRVLHALYAISSLVGIVAFAAMVQVFVIRRLKNVSRGIHQISQGNLDCRIEDKGKDEIHDMAQDFNSMAQMLEQNVFFNRDFTRNVSHELKTPISNIAGYAELLRDAEVSEEERAKYVDAIYQESMRALETGSHLIGLSRLDSTDPVRTDDRYDIAEQIRELILHQQDAWSAKSVEMQVDLPATAWQSNRNLTYHIFQNLISNAVKYVDDHGKISVSLEPCDDGLLFRISNTGEGIAEENLDKIFLPFYVGDRSKVYRSTGLGLCITHKIVTKLGGKITVESRLNEQTTFTVYLPKISV